MPFSPTPEPVLKPAAGTTVAGKQPKRACDCCRKRKVKCDSKDPCSPCKKASIKCAFLQPPKKKGPKGLRSARVLHALRTIGERVSASPRLAPDIDHGEIRHADWTIENGLLRTHSFPGQDPIKLSLAQKIHNPLPNTTSAHRTRFDHSRQVPMPRNGQSIQAQRSTYEPLLQQRQSWAASPAELASSNPCQRSASISPVSIPILQTRRVIKADTLLPYVKLFFNHMFPIMPVVDDSEYLNPSLYSNIEAMPPETYCFLCALSAATSVQLDRSIEQPRPLHPTKGSDVVLAEECLRERSMFDTIETNNTVSILTSFFLFAYYGNHEKHAKAWHYLQESITFAEILNMDDESSYAELNETEGKWRRRLYWLLFITERAYAVQRRKHARLHASVRLPAVVEDPQHLTGFNDLAGLFSAVDDSFVNAWRQDRRLAACDKAWLAQRRREFDSKTRAFCVGDSRKETQHLDISVTREWLHLLAWQLYVCNGLMLSGSVEGMGSDYPITLAGKVIEITSGANKHALESHGIGMEQKLSDIACCLVDALKINAYEASNTFNEGKRCLNLLVDRLSNIRGRESRYLRPLLCKVEAYGLLQYDIGTQFLPSVSSLPPNNIVGEFPLSHPNFAPVYTGWPSPTQLETPAMNNIFTAAEDSRLSGVARQREGWQQRRILGQVETENDVEMVPFWLVSPD